MYHIMYTILTSVVQNITQLITHRVITIFIGKRQVCDTIVHCLFHFVALYDIWVAKSDHLRSRRVQQ